jgi:preprotein translocase subunit YajC
MNNMHYLLSAAGSATEGGTVMDSIISFAPIVVVLIVFYFMLIRPQQKKDKEDRAMRENLEIGDEIITAGGIVGLVVSIKEDTVVIETGSDRSKIRIAKWAVAQNITAKEKAGK